MTFGWSEAISAFAGAAFAFAIDLLRESISIRREQRDSCNRALLALTQMYGDLSNIWRQVYSEPVAEAAQHHVLPPPTIVMPLAGINTPTSVDAASLVFLSRSTAPDLPHRLALIATRYSHHLEAETLRATAHLEMQGKFEAAGHARGAIMSVEDAANLCGPRLWHQLVAFTESQVEGIPRTLRDMEEFQDQFLSVVRYEFPASTFMKFQPAEVVPGETFGKLEIPDAALWRRAVRKIVVWLRNRNRPRKKVA